VPIKIYFYNFQHHTYIQMYRLCFIYNMYRCSSFLVEFSNKTKLYNNNRHIFFSYEFSLATFRNLSCVISFSNIINKLQTLLNVNNKNKLPTYYTILLYCYKERNSIVSFWQPQNDYKNKTYKKTYLFFCTYCALLLK